MTKILLLEDIVPIALAIQNSLALCEVHMFHSARSFLSSKTEAELKKQIASVDVFLLDFDLGDATIASSSIYKMILENKNSKALMCCISSHRQPYIEQNCVEIYSSLGLSSAFHYYLKKDSDIISAFLKKLQFLS